MRDPRLEKLADVIVNYSIGVKKGQLVRISGPAVSVPLLMEFYRKVLAAGGHAFVRLGVEDQDVIFLKHASEEQLKFLNPITLYEVETIDCSIGVWANTNSKALTGADPKKLGLSQATRKPLMDKYMKRSAEGKLNWVGTLFPTELSLIHI